VTDAAPSHRDRWSLAGGGLVASLAVLILVCHPWDLRNAFMIGAPVGRDFANFWLAGRLALEGRLDLLVDLPGYNALLFHVFDHFATDWLAFSYPPTALLFLAPFGALPHLPAVLLWTAANLALMAGAIRLLSADRALPWIVCISPGAFMMVAFGHFGGALGFLATYALTGADRRPALAGICLALLGVKPQFAASLAVLLLLTGGWRVVAYAVPASAALVAASVVAFGIQPWLNFFEWTIPFQNRVMANIPDKAFWMMSVYTTARMAGLPQWAAWALQVPYSAAVMAGAVFLLLRKRHARATIALALFAAIAALPYAAIYDLAVTAPALAVAMLAGRPGEPGLAPGWAAVALWLAPAFAIPFGLMGLPIVPAIIALMVLIGLLHQCGLPGSAGVGAVGLRPDPAETHP
jgi:hypothetical protein